MHTLLTIWNPIGTHLEPCSDRVPYQIDVNTVYNLEPIGNRLEPCSDRVPNQIDVYTAWNLEPDFMNGGLGLYNT